MTRLSKPPIDFAVLRGARHCACSLRSSWTPFLDSRKIAKQCLQVWDKDTLTADDFMGEARVGTLRQLLHAHGSAMEAGGCVSLKERLMPRAGRADRAVRGELCLDLQACAPLDCLLHCAVRTARTDDPADARRHGCMPRTHACAHARMHECTPCMHARHARRHARAYARTHMRTCTHAPCKHARHAHAHHAHAMDPHARARARVHTHAMHAIHVMHACHTIHTCCATPRRAAQLIQEYVV